MNIANRITIFRLVLVPFFVGLLLNGFYLWSILVFFVACITDNLDGIIARKQGKVTDFGKFIDPLADKALIMSAFVCFVEFHKVSAVAVILMLVREFTVTSVRLVASRKGTVLCANLWGKMKTIMQIIAVFLVLLTFLDDFSLLSSNFLIYLKDIAILISVGISILSGAIYCYENYKFIEEN